MNVFSNRVEIVTKAPEGVDACHVAIKDGFMLLTDTAGNVLPGQKDFILKNDLDSANEVTITLMASKYLINMDSQALDLSSKESDFFFPPIPKHPDGNQPTGLTIEASLNRLKYNHYREAFNQLLLRLPVNSRIHKEDMVNLIESICKGVN